ncbi:MAG: ArsA family ATPase, partial [Nannocystaceae bacterium]
MALAAARGGRRVLVVTIDPSRRLAQALGFAGSVQPGVELPVQTPALANTKGSLHALLLDGQVVFDRLVAAYATDAAQAKRIVHNPLYKTMTEHLGGALEYAAIAQLRLLHREGRYDLIVLDTPPTANALDFLQAPERIQELVTNPAIRLLTGTGKLGSRLLGVGNGLVLKVLAAMGGGEFVRDLGIFLRDFSVVLDQFHRQAGDFQALLTSETTGAFLVTSAATFSVREAVAFLGVLHERSLRVDGVVLNRVTPPFEPFPEQDA